MKFIRSLTVLMLIFSLLLAGCTKNIMLTVYGIQENYIVAKRIKAETLSPESVLEYLKNEGIVNSATTLLNFKSEGSDDYRQLTLDFSTDFKSYISTLQAEYQKLVIQAVANTYLVNFSAEAVKITADGQVIKTGIYDFSQSFTLTEAGTTADEININTPIPTPVPTPTQTPIVTPTPTPDTKTEKPKETPLVTPPRESGKKYVAVTFDDGPHSKYTKLIADEIKKYNASATFFVVGNRVDEATGPILKYAQDQGCEIAIHAYTHEVYYDKCSTERFNEELTKTRDVIKKYTGKTPTMMRPVGGRITDARVKMSPYSVIMWNVDSEDWKHKKSGQGEIDTIVNNVMNTVGDGKIILMHDIYSNTYEAFCIIIKKLYENGYEVVSVTELLGKENVKPATKHFGA